MIDCINYMNGTWKTGLDSTVPVYDAGFLLGDGVFETIRFDSRKLFFPEKHFAMLPLFLLKTQFLCFNFFIHEGILRAVLMYR